MPWPTTRSEGKGEDEMDSRPKPRIMTKSHGPAFDSTSSVGKREGR